MWFVKVAFIPHYTLRLILEARSALTSFVQLQAFKHPICCLSILRCYRTAHRVCR